MSNKVVFEVYVDDNGTLKAATQGVRGLGAEVNKTASAHKNASKEADSHFNRQEKGVIGTANSTKNFAKLRQTLDGGSNSLVGAYATLAANIFAVSAAYLALKDAAQLQQVEAGLRSMGNQMGVTLELTTKNVQALSGGLLNAQQAARSTAQVISAGFSTKELERITVVARQASLTLGRDTTDSMDRLTRGIIKLEPELIDELGIMTRLDEATAIYAVQLGKSASALTTTEKRQGFLNAALAEGELKFGAITGNDNLNNLAKLGTEFQNLTKDVLNLVNVLALPLADVLGSRGLLIGGAVLFASTISSQLLPGLSKAAEKSTKVAQEMSKITKEAAANAKVTGGRQGATFTGVKNDIKNGTADFEQLQVARNSVARQIVLAEEKLAGTVKFVGKETVNSVTKSIAIRKQELVLIQQLTTAEGKAAASRAASSAINAASGDITGLSSGKAAFSAMFTGISESTNSYSKSLRAAAIANGTFTATNTVMGRGIIFTKTAMYGAALGAKVFGAALLNMLPIIGQVILVATILFEGLKVLYTSIVGKEVIEANKKLKTIMDELKNKAAERKKISEASISAAMKEQKSSELLSNAIKEVSDAYNEANKARKSQLATAGTTSGIRRDGSLAPSRNAVSDKSALEQINKLRLLDPLVEKAINNSIEFAGGSEKVRKSTKLQAQVLNEVNKAFTGYGPAVSATAEAMKELNAASTALTKSSIPTTQYDAFATALANTNSELARLTVEATSSGKGVAGMAAVISGLGPDIQKFLAPDTRDTISQYNTQTALVTKLTAEGYKRTEAEKEQLKVAQNMVPSLQSRLSLVSSELMILSDTVTARQVESIVLTSIIALEQARLNKMNKTAALTGEEVKRRINAENNILAVQARQIIAATWALKLELDSIKLIREKDEAYKKYVATIKSGSLESELINVAERIGAIELQIARETSTVNKGLYVAEIDILRKKEAAILSEKTTRNREAILQAGISAAQNQAAAIQIGMTSKAVALARAELQDKETALNVLNEKLQVQEAAVKLAQTEYSFADAVGTTRNVEYLSSLAYYNKILPLMKSRADLEEAVALAAIEATIAEKRSAGGSEKDIIVLDAQKKAVYETAILKKAQLDIDAKSNLFKSLGVLKQHEALELQKQALDILLEQANALESAANSAANLAKEQRTLAINKLGRALNPTEERKIAIDIAKVAYDAAVASEDIKKDSVAMEYKLLKAKYAYDKTSASQKISNLDDEIQKSWDPAEIKAMQESRAAYASYVDSINKVLLGLPAATAAAVIEIDNSVKSLGVALEQARLPAARLSGPPESSGANLRALGPDDTISQRLTALNADLDPVFEKLRTLGPNGEFVSSLAQGSLVIADSILKIGEAGITSADRLSAMGAIVGQIASIAQASAKAKIAAIDSEISAEQKRDGKSAQSVALLASLEKKKDSAARKAFDVNKKLMMAQVVMSTAASIAMVMGQTGIFGIPLVPIFAALGAAQLAIIAGSSYQGGASAAGSAASTPASLSIGTRSNSVDLARNNSNAGGESGYVTGAMGQGSDASNFKRAAYGGRAGIIVGEKGPEKIYPDVSSTIVSNEAATKESSGGVNASFNIQAVDAEGVEKVLLKNRGAIISMLREAANSNGQTFLENVNVAKYRQGGSKL